MEREDLLKSRIYWITQMQMGLFEVINNYMKENNLSQTEFAKQIGVNKSYVSQILNGNFDHKISKYVDLLLACGKAPLINAVDLQKHIDKDISKSELPDSAIQNGIVISMNKNRVNGKTQRVIEKKLTSLRKIATG